jgi:hypothetical protein
MAVTGLDVKQAREEVFRIVGRPSSKGASKRILKTYPYTDEAGALLFETVRYDPKDFSQRRPDGQGGWIPNLKGVRRVLYRLPVLINADIVFMAEGEKDADALNKLGVVATTSPLGAGKWKPEYAESLRGKQVFVIPDADEKGRKHADDVLRSLDGVASSAKLVELPGAKDASEWIERGGTLEALIELAARADADPVSCTQSKESSPSGTELLDQIEQLIRRYLVLPVSTYLPLTLWALATHAFRLFDCFPYIAVVSAAKRSGKTRLAEVLETIVRCPWRGTAPSPAALYRMLERGLTLLLDETELLNTKNKSEATQTILAVLNAGHRKGGTIPRCEGPRQDVRDFHVYGPKLFAAIGRLPDTLMDRSIIIQIKRRTKTQKVERFRQAAAALEAKPIREGAVRFMEAHVADIERAYQESLKTDLEFLNDRDADVWTPLFVVCSVAAPERVQELEKCARLLSADKAGDDVDDSLSLTLLRDIRDVWEGAENKEVGGKGKCETAVLLEKLNALEESPWGEHPLTPRRLARMLRPFDVEPRNIQIETRRPKGYHFDDFKDAFDRYLD